MYESSSPLEANPRHKIPSPHSRYLPAVQESCPLAVSFTPDSSQSNAANGCEVSSGSSQEFTLKVLWMAQIRMLSGEAGLQPYSHLSVALSLLFWLTQGTRRVHQQVPVWCWDVQNSCTLAACRQGWQLAQRDRAVLSHGGSAEERAQGTCCWSEFPESCVRTRSTGRSRVMPGGSPAPPCQSHPRLCFYASRAGCLLYFCLLPGRERKGDTGALHAGSKNGKFLLLRYKLILWLKKT